MVDSDVTALKYISVVLGSFSGLFICIARLANRSLLHEIYITLFKRRISHSWALFEHSKDMRVPFKDFMDFKGSNAYMYYSDIYDKITKHVILT